MPSNKQQQKQQEQQQQQQKQQYTVISSQAQRLNKVRVQGILNIATGRLKRKFHRFVKRSHRCRKVDTNARNISEKLELRRKRERERKRLVRANLDPVKLAEIRRKDAERKKQYRASLCGEELLKMRHRNAEYKRKYRASMTPEQLAELRYKNAQRKRWQRLQRKLQLSKELPQTQETEDIRKIISSMTSNTEQPQVVPPQYPKIENDFHPMANKPVVQYQGTYNMLMPPPPRVMQYDRMPQ